jgi:glycosyltransferase involved in cell wall biosynthesis
VRIFNFVEGAWPRPGGVGIGCVPKIGLSLAASGVRVVLVCGGPPTPGYESLVQPDVRAASSKSIGRGSFAIVTVRSWGKYAFAPSILWHVGPHVCDADALALHSVYSFPVLAGYLLARLWRRPYVVWPHGVLAPFMRRIGRRKKWIYDALFARRMLKGAAAIICTGEGERREVHSIDPALRTVVVPHGIALNSFDSLPERGRFRARYMNGHQGPLILYLGRLAAVKNPRLLIAAFAQVLTSTPSARLALVGPPDPPSFAQTVAGWLREFGVVGETAVTGAITDMAAKQEALADADVFVMPSHTENFCHALFEAMAAGLPSIVSDSVNYGGEVAANGAGLALRREPDEFARGILRLLGDSELRREMGSNARRMAAGYSWEKCGERIGATLRSVIAGQPLPADLAGHGTPTFEVAP